MKMDMYGFYTGQVFDAYEWLGAHVTGEGVVFRTFAPNAQRVDVLWKNKLISMQPIHDGNFYEAIIPNVKPGDTYEYRIYGKQGGIVDHCDPYGFGMELRPNHKSIIRDMNEYSFRDKKWMANRTSMLDKPLNIYELHLGSWRKKSDAEDGWYRYDELAEPLIRYMKDSGYNYVEFMPLSEHPCDESWGYQNTGFFAPTSRYGTMNDLKRLVDLLHQNQIGVILDYVPVHFAIDQYALAKYDGDVLYEYPHNAVGVSEWGSYNFMHSRGEVRSFLQSAANYWLKEYHFDGLRMDAISRIIYWQGDEKRGENGNAVDFIKVMNKGLKEKNPGCMLIAEDSTNYPNVTLEVDKGGLGFDYKWDMGWMNDTLTYFKTHPYDRKKDYHKLTFSMMYYYDEKFLLPFSHDEVVHGKATIVQKMNGQYEEKFPQAKAMYMYMYAHPGKKLNFMGNEIAQLREWDEKREQDWDMRKYPKHDSFYQFMKELNQIYLKYPALSKMDFEREGFRWIDCHMEERRVYAFERTDGKQRIFALFNFSDEEQKEMQFKILECKSLELLLASDAEQYGGQTRYKKKANILAKEEVVEIDMVPFSAHFYLVQF